MICTLITKNGTDNWCIDCDMAHEGHYRGYSQDPGDKGEEFRRHWRRLNTPPEKKLLRSLPMAKQCKYFGLQLTKEEVAQQQLMGCRTCNNEVPAYHCNLPGQKKFNDGPYTYKGVECMSCTDWQPKPHENPSLPEGISWPHRIDEKNFATGVKGLRFNPSLIKWPA